jgi:sugar lactone lactonase YvrE
LAFDRAGNLFVASSGAGVPPQPPSTIVKITPAGTQTQFADLGRNGLLGMAFDNEGNLFLSVGGGIFKITPDGTRSVFASTVDGVWALAFDRLGNLYAGVNPIGSSAILKFAPDGSKSTFVTLPGNRSVTALAFNSAGDLFAQFGNSIVRVTPNRDLIKFHRPGFRR